MAPVMPMSGIAVMIALALVMFEMTPDMMSEVTLVLRVRVAVISTVEGDRMMPIVCLGRSRQAEGQARDKK